MIEFVRELAPNHLEWRNSLSTRLWTRQSEIQSKAEHERWLDALLDDGSKRFMGVLSDGIEVGTVGFTSIKKLERTAEFSLLIGTEHRGNGLGTETLRAWLDYGFEELSLDLIWGETFIYPKEATHMIPEDRRCPWENGALINPAYKVFSKTAGYTQEGWLKKRYRKFGYPIDCLSFSYDRS